MNIPLEQYVALSRRSLLGSIRQPTSLFPSMLFPLIFLALTSAALHRATGIPGFPAVDSFVQFAAATTVIQGTLFGAISAGADMATDIEGGFFERLIAAPVARTSILAGRVMGAATVGFVQALVFLSVVAVFRVPIAGGLPAVVMIATTAGLFAAGIGSIFMAFALRTGSKEAVQGAFPLLFVTLFLSSAFFPRELMEGWFQSVAGINPLSHLIEGLREQVISGVDVSSWLISLSVAGGIFALGLAVSLAALRGRLQRSN